MFADVGLSIAFAPANASSTLTIGSGVTISASPPSAASMTIGLATAPLINNGTITCNNSLARMTITGASWINNGTINIGSGSLTLGGTITTADLGTIHNTGGTLILGGTLDNSAGTLDLANTGSLELAGGTVHGGTILSTDPGAALFTNGNSATLDGVTLDVDLDHDVVRVDSGNISVTNGLTLQNHNIILVSGCGVTSTDASTYGGTGEMIVNNLNNSSNFTSQIGGTNVTIGPNVTITTGSGSSVDNYISITTVLNEGTIAIGSQGTPITIGNSIPWTNAGNISVASQTLLLNGTWTNTGRMTATGGRLALGGTWSNQGAITATNAALYLEGPGSGLNSISVINGSLVVGGGTVAFGEPISVTYTTDQLRSVSRSQSSIGVAGGGTIDNTGDTLNADATAPIQLLGGTIHGGTITSTNGGQVVASSPISTLDTVTLDAPLTGGELAVNNLVNNSAISIGSGGLYAANGTWTNNGSITTSNASVKLNSMPTSIGSFSITGGYADLFGPAITAQLNQIRCSNVPWSLNNGAILDNIGSNLVLSASGSRWYFLGGEIDGGSITSSDGTQLVITRSGSYLFTSLIINGVTLGTNTLIQEGVTPTIENGLTLANNATIQLGVSPYGTGNLTFSGTQTLTGVGTILLQGDSGTGTNNFYCSSGILTIDTHITVAAGGKIATVGKAATGAIVNDGLISSPTSGIKLTIAGNFTNNGTVQASNGGTVTFSSPGLLTNLQSGSLVGGNWLVDAGSTLDFPSTSIYTSAASVTLSGVASNFIALATMSDNTGSLAVTGGRTLSLSSAGLTNDGLLAVDSSSELDVGSLLEQSDGTLAFELSEDASGLLVSSGPVSLGGALALTLAPGYDPLAGDSLLVLSGTSLSGNFGSILTPTLPTGIAYTLDFSGNALHVDFVSVPEPATLPLAACTALLMLLWRRSSFTKSGRAAPAKAGG